MIKPTLINRRQLLGGTAGVLAASMLPVSRALATAPVSGNNLKFVFVMNYGGWDPTRVFANEFWNGFVDMERDAEPVSIGDLTYVAHSDRPSVDTFFQRYGQQSLILNGVQVPSVAHLNCLRLMMTGSTSSERADWPAIVGHSRAEEFALPHIVIQGPAFPGPAGSAVTRTGSSGQLEGMLSGDIIAWSDLQTSKPNSQAEARMDDYLSRRLAAVADTHGSAAMRARAESYLTAQQRSVDLKDLADVLDWSGGTELGSQVDLAVDALSMGISRCAMLSSGYGWDTHSNNDEQQSDHFEGLFDSLVGLMEKMASMPGESTDYLIDETVLVVLSEMGRTPQLNSNDGKDHWPYTSVLVSGPRITGGRVVGCFDNYYYGKTIDRKSGEISDKGHDLNVEELGATLMMVADIDPGDHLTGVQGISGVIDA